MCAWVFSCSGLRVFIVFIAGGYGGLKHADEGRTRREEGEGGQRAFVAMMSAASVRGGRSVKPSRVHTLTVWVSELALYKNLPGSENNHLDSKGRLPRDCVGTLH